MSWHFVTHDMTTRHKKKESLWEGRVSCPALDFWIVSLSLSHFIAPDLAPITVVALGL